MRLSLPVGADRGVAVPGTSPGSFGRPRPPAGPSGRLRRMLAVAALLTLSLASSVITMLPRDTRAATAELAGTEYVANCPGNSVTVYAPGAAGNAGPIRTISGAATGLNCPGALVFGPSGNLYVANSGGSGGVTEYAPGAGGNAVPIVTIGGPATGLNGPVGLVLDSSGTLYVANRGGTSSITEYASGSAGNAAPARLISGAATGLNQPWGLAFDASGTLSVANYGGDTVTRYASGATGNAVPIGVIAGPATGLVAPDAVLFDASGTLYVANRNGNSITEYAPGASGDASPVATIAGAATGLNAPSDLVFDGSGTLYVACPGGNSVAAFASGAVGNALPVATISGPATGLSGPWGVALSVVSAVTASVTALTSNLNPSPYGTGVFFTAKVTPSAPVPTGTVTFRDGAATLSAVPLDAAGAAIFGSATLAVAGSPHSITAVYSGDGTHSPGTSSALGQVVNAAPSGPLWSWGKNDFGELGTGSITNYSGCAVACSSTPVKPVVVGSDIVAAAAGNATSALDSTGHVYSWGTGGNGELGVGTSCGASPCLGSTTPLEVLAGACGTCSGGHLDHIIQIAQGAFSQVALRDDGTVWTWGANSSGELGDGTVIDSFVPAKVLAGTCACGGTLSGVVAIASAGHTVSALRYDGGVWTWGYNGYGALGNNTIVDAHTPVQTSNSSGAGPLTGIVSIGAGGGSTYAVTSSGAALAWGRGDMGQIGNGLTAPVNMLPRAVSGLGAGTTTRVAGASATAYALLTDGTVRSWGDGGSGQLGDGGPGCGAEPCVGSATPVAVSGLGGVTSIATGAQQGYAVGASGNVFSWGQGMAGGDMGNGTLADSNVPMQPKRMANSMVNVWGGGSAVAHLATGRITPAIALTSSLNPTPVGGAVTYTATATPTTPLPGGAVTFTDSGFVITGCAGMPLNGSGQAACTAATYGSAGTHPIVASLTGDADYLGGTSPTLTEAVGTWSIATAPAGNIQLTGVACAATSDCWAVGSVVGATNKQTVILEWKGVAWATVASPSVATTQDNVLTGVSCASPTLCFAAGYVNNGGTALTLVERWDGIAWVIVPSVSPPAPARLTGIACPTPAMCMAVGYQGATDQPLAEAWNGASWVPVSTATTGAARANQLLGVTCITPADCWAVGTATLNTGVLQTLTEHWTGGAFAILTSANTGSSADNALSGVSCLAAGDCWAAGYSVNAAVNRTVTQHWDGSTWSVAPSANNGGGSNTLTSTTCAAVTSCFAVGNDVAGGFNQTLAESYDGGAPWVVMGSPGSGATQNNFLNGVACASPTNCWAVGFSVPGATSAALIVQWSAAGGKTGTGVTVGSSAGPSVSGQAVTYTATITPQTGGPSMGGSVFFADGGSVIPACPGQPVTGLRTATCTITYLGTASSPHAVTATYTGDAGYYASASPQLAQFVTAAATTTVLTSSATPSASGQTVTLTATVSVQAPGAGTPAGTVGFSDDGVAMAGCTTAMLSGMQAVCSVSDLAAGSHTITATFAGTADFAAADAPPIIQDVGRADTTTTVTAVPVSAVVGQPVTYTATVTPVAPGAGTPAGTAVFRDGGVVIPGCGAAGLSGGAATCSVTYSGATGPSIGADYGGDPDFAASTSAILSTVVSTAGTVTTVGSASPTGVTGQPVTFTAQVAPAAPATGIPTGSMQFLAGALALPGCGAVPLDGAGSAACTFGFSAGSVSITAAYNGSGPYGPSTSPPTTQTTVPAGTNVAVTATPNPAVTGQPVTYSATVGVIAPGTGSPTGTVGFTDGGGTVPGCGAQPLTGTTATCSVTYTTAGNHSVVAAYGGDANYQAQTSPALAQSVDPAPTGVTFTAAPAATVTGQAATFTATVAAAAPGTGVPTGTVSFSDNGIGTPIPGCAAAVLSGGMATCTTTALTPGSHSVQVQYPSDGNYGAGASAASPYIVTQAATATTLVSSTNPAGIGQTVTYTAAVTTPAPGGGTPGGTLVFADGGVPIPSCAGPLTAGGNAQCVVTYPVSGSHSIAAGYGGSSGYTSSSAQLTETVVATATATAINSSPNPGVYGENVVYTVTVAPAVGGPVMTGTIRLTDNLTAIPGCGAVPVTGSRTASCSTGAMTVAGGPHSVVATYGGDPNFGGSNSPALIQAVSPASTTTVVTSTPSPSVFGQAVDLTATVSIVAPGAGTMTGTIAFLDGGVTIAGCAAQSVSANQVNCTVTPPAAGNHTFTAVYSGDGNVAGSTATGLPATVGRAATTTAVSPAPNPSAYGEPVTVTATVLAVAPGSGVPTGTIQFLDAAGVLGGCNARPLSAGQATCTTAAFAVGSHALSAVFSGDPGFSASTSPQRAQAVARAATSSGLGASPPSAVSGQPVTYTATVVPVAPGAGTPGAVVSFLDSGVAIPGCAAQSLAGGVASCAVSYASPVSRTISATYGGDPGFAPSTSPNLAMVVVAGTASTTITSSAPAGVTGEPVTFTAHVAAVAPATGTATGSVTFRQGALVLPGCGSVALTASASATCGASFSVGTASISAAYSGSAAFTSSTSAPATQTTTAAMTTVAVAASAGPSVTGQPVGYTAAVSVTAPGGGTPTGVVAFTDGGTGIPGCGARPLGGAAATCTVTYSAAGGHSITAAYGGDAEYQSATSPVSPHTVNPATTAITLAAAPASGVTGQPLTFTASVTTVAPGAGVPTGAVAFTDNGSTISGCAASPLTTGSAGCTTTTLAPGSHSIQVLYPGDGNFAASVSTPAPLTIAPAATATVLTSSDQPAGIGQIVTYTASVTARAPGGGGPSGSVTFADGGVPIPSCGAQPVTAGVARCAGGYAVTGSHAISATYGGSSGYTSSSAGLTETVVATATTAALTSSANPAVVGQTVIFTMAVSPSGATPPMTGTVTFADNLTTIPGCGAVPVTAGGTASCSVVFTAVSGGAQHSVTGWYAGDATFGAAGSPAVAQTVGAAATTTTLASAPGATVVGQTMAYTATVTVAVPGVGAPSGTVTFTDGGATIPGCSGRPMTGTTAVCSIAYPAVGSHAISARYDGGVNFATSPWAGTLTRIVGQAQTAVTVTSATFDSPAGQGVTYTLAVEVAAPGQGNPAGTSVFLDDGSVIPECGAQPIGDGTANCAVVYSVAGTHSITAGYTGSANFAAGVTPLAMVQVIAPLPVAAALSSSGNPSVSGQAITVIATVSGTRGTPTGRVGFTANGMTVPGCGGQWLINGSASCGLTLIAAGGTVSVSAVYGGDATFAAGSSNRLEQSVVRAASAIALSVPADVVGYGRPLTLRAWVGSAGTGLGAPAGTVTFSGDGVTRCVAQLAGEQAACTLAALTLGVHQFAAAYLGDANFAPPERAARAAASVRDGTTIGIVTSGTPSIVGDRVTFTATVRAVSAPEAPAGQVVFSDGGTTIGTATLDANHSASLATTTLVAAAHAVVATYPGSGDFGPSMTPPVLQVVQAPSMAQVLGDVLPGDAGASTGSAGGGRTAPPDRARAGYPAPFTSGRATAGPGAAGAGGDGTAALPPSILDSAHIPDIQQLGSFSGASFGDSPVYLLTALAVINVIAGLGLRMVRRRWLTIQTDAI